MAMPCCDYAISQRRTKFSFGMLWLWRFWHLHEWVWSFDLSYIAGVWPVEHFGRPRELRSFMSTQLPLAVAQGAPAMAWRTYQQNSGKVTQFASVWYGLMVMRCCLGSASDGCDDCSGCCFCFCCSSRSCSSCSYCFCSSCMSFVLFCFTLIALAFVLVVGWLSTMPPLLQNGLPSVVLNISDFLK